MDISESRYDRAERITWWDQSLLKSSRVLVVGAGALGNEIVKNLTLVGVGSIDVVDMDSIEHSNLSRCVFFRDGDEGQSKAELLVSRAASLNPDVELTAYHAPVQKLGTAFLGKYSLVIGALDNREARLWTSRACRLNNLLFVDAAIEGLHAVVRVFEPGKACYACTLSEIDWQVLNKRRSCALLQRDDIAQGKTPTNATTSSLASAVQVQESIKHLVGKTELVALKGKAWHLMGEEMASFVVELSEDPDCLEHFEIEKYLEIEFTDSKTLNDVLEPFLDSGELWTLDDFVYIGTCAQAHVPPVAGFRSLLKSEQAICHECETELPVETVSVLSREFPGMNLPLASLFFPKSEYLIHTAGSCTSAIAIKTGEK